MKANEVRGEIPLDHAAIAVGLPADMTLERLCSTSGGPETTTPLSQIDSPTSHSNLCQGTFW
jgi:hypothetical protein